MPAFPRLLGVATAVPPHVLPQEAVASGAQALFAPEMPGFERLAPVYRNSAVDRRYSCVPLDWYQRRHDFAERNALYLENAVPLLERVARQLLDEAQLSAEEIDGLVVASTTGIATPSLDALLMERLPFRRDTLRLPIFGLGCVGGVLGLARTAALARAMPGRRFLFLVVELCGLTFRAQDRSKSNVIATALFGDGAGGALLCASDSDAPAILGSGEHTWPDSLDVMGWQVRDDGLAVVFSRDIPTLVQQQFCAAMADFLARQGLRREDLSGMICHPGGAKVVDALEEAAGLPAGALWAERAVLREYGNMSAATVLFVLARRLQGGLDGRQLMSALGPGFSAGFLLLDA